MQEALTNPHEYQASRAPVTILPPRELFRPRAAESTWNAETRRSYLIDTPAAGFTRPEHTLLVDDLVAIGLPVHNIRRLVRRRNGRGSEGVLGSWGVADHNQGEFSVYSMLDSEVPERRLQTLVHESLHANSPFEPKNAALFGGEGGRRESAQFAVDVANQAMLTGKYLDGYHRYLTALYMQGQISAEHLAEETLAITGQHALTDRKHLAQVQEAQRAVFLRRRALGYISPDVAFTELMSHSQGKQMRLAGADKLLTTLLDGVKTYPQLVEHAGKLKARFASRPHPRPQAQPETYAPGRPAIVIIIPFDAFVASDPYKVMSYGWS